MFRKDHRVTNKATRKAHVQETEGGNTLNNKKGVEIYAGDGADFQEYIYENGLRVKAGTLIGHERKDNHGKWQLHLLPNIRFSPEPRIRKNADTKKPQPHAETTGTP
jgi:hypothetical protein